MPQTRLTVSPATLAACLVATLATVVRADEPPEAQFALPLPAVATGGRQAIVESESYVGRVLDNVANAERQGSGFNPLCYRIYPDKPVYSTRDTGLNFEHIFNGVAADKRISMFTPRTDPVELRQSSPTSVSLHWKAEQSAWGLDCQLTYTLAGRDAIDIEFAATPTQDRFGQDYAAFMWASYMACARDRRIYFMGATDDQEGWVAFGEDRDGDFETGTVSSRGAAPLPYEEGSQTLNIVEHPTKQFSRPFFYGLIDGDHKLETTDDTLAYIMMFDQEMPIRFAMWNFAKDATGQADPHRPAWDWQFVIHNPVIGRQYSYRARLLIRPFTNREEVLALYETWAKMTKTAGPQR